MNRTVRHILAVLAGIVFGSMINMLIISSSAAIIPPPPGVDVTTPEGLKAGIHLFEARHFIFPFLAHALGTLSGAWLAALIAVRHKMKFAIGIGCFFLIGGIASIFMIPAPLWYIITDLLLAYIPMAYLAGKLVRK